MSDTSKMQSVTMEEKEYFLLDESESILTLTTVALIDDNDGEASVDSTCSTDGFQCVSFDKTPQVFEIPSRFENTAENMAATYYSREEQKAMREKEYDQAGSWAYNSDAVACSRGLESLTQSGSQQRKLNRCKVLVAVLREQR